jgi:hypothetical protein
MDGWMETAAKRSIDCETVASQLELTSYGLRRNQEEEEKEEKEKE